MHHSKKILIFSLAYYPHYIGGAEIAVKEITDRISDIEFSMITIRGDHNLGIEKIGNVMIYRVGPQVNTNNFFGKIIFQISKYIYPFLAFNRARILHQRKPFDAVWSIMANYAGFGALFFKLRFRSIPFILTLQEGDPIPYIKRRVMLVYPLFKLIFMKADRIQAISNYLGKLACNMGFPGTPTIIPNGVNISHFGKEYSSDQISMIRNNFGFGNQKLLVTTSRLVKKNGVADVIRSLPELLGYTFIVIGSGQLELSLRKLAKQLGVQERVIFFGYISHENLPLYLRASDIFIRPSLSEGLGNSFLEAMAAGIPVIATQVGGIPDFLKHKETGLFCNPNDPVSIVEQIHALEDSSLRTRIISSAQALVSKKYDWNQIADSYRKIF